MTFKELKTKIKEEQKQLAKQIRRGKFLRKPKNRFNLTDEDKRLFFYRYSEYKEKFFGGVIRLSNEYRHIHIAYCEFFNNTPYEKIEQPRYNLYVNRPKIDKMKKDWENQIDEAVRSSAA